MLYVQYSWSGTRERENFIQFVAIHDFTYWLSTIWRHSSRVAIGNALYAITWQESRAMQRVSVYDSLSKTALCVAYRGKKLSR